MTGCGFCACIFCPFQARVRLSAVATGAQSSEFRLRTVTPNAGRAGTMGTSWKLFSSGMTASVCQVASVMSNSLPAMGCSCQTSLCVGFSRREYWSLSPCLPSWGLPHPGTKPASLTPPALAGGFFPTRAAWEVLEWLPITEPNARLFRNHKNICNKPKQSVVPSQPALSWASHCQQPLWSCRRVRGCGRNQGGKRQWF